MNDKLDTPEKVAKVFSQVMDGMANEGMSLDDMRKSEPKPVKAPFSFKYIQMKNIACECVVDDKDSMTGEYHIAVKDPRHTNPVMNDLRNIETARVEHVDPDGMLGLDYPICVTIEGLIFRESIDDVLQEIDNKLN